MKWFREARFRRRFNKREARLNRILADADYSDWSLTTSFHHLSHSIYHFQHHAIPDETTRILLVDGDRDAFWAVGGCWAFLDASSKGQSPFTITKEEEE